MSVWDKLKSLLSTSSPTTPEVKPKEKKYGTHGRLEIPELSIEMPLYDAKGVNAQSIVDAADSAAIFQHGSQTMIADHVSQGMFANLINCRPGKTKAYIRYQEGRSEEYLCHVSQYAHIHMIGTGNVLLDWRDDPVSSKNPGGLSIYTCLGFRHGDIQDVTLTYWKKAESEKGSVSV